MPSGEQGDSARAKDRADDDSRRAADCVCDNWHKDGGGGEQGGGFVVLPPSHEDGGKGAKDGGGVEVKNTLPPRQFNGGRGFLRCGTGPRTGYGDKVGCGIPGHCDAA